MRRIPTSIWALLAAVVLLNALSGCASFEEQQTVVVPLRDDASAADVEILQSALAADDRVDACVYVHENVSPGPQQTAVSVEASGPEGDPLAESWLEITLAAGLTGAEREALLRSLETNLVFDRTVLVTDSGNWWNLK